VGLIGERRAVRDRLADIVGSVYVADAPAALAIDGVRPRFVARPADVEQVSRLTALARDEGWAVVPRGSGTALGLGNPPARADLLLDLARLHRVVQYEPADVTVAVEAGACLEELDRTLGKHGQFLPLDPPGWRTRTLGGVLATNASGPLRSRYGTARDLLLGVRFVQADGTVTWGGARVVKSVTGYDVPKLLVGSLGTLGIIVEATLRLHAQPEAEGSWVSRFGSVDAAQAFVLALGASTVQPACVEILDAGTLEAIGEAPAACAVAVSIATVADAVRAQGEMLDRLAAREHGATSRPRDGFWTAYDMSTARPPADGVVVRAACLPTGIAATLRALDAIARGANLRWRASGCGPSGSLRAFLEGERPAQLWRDRVVSPLREHLAAGGGSAVVEHCAPGLKAALDVWGPVAPDSLALMRRIKLEFDPGGVLNPGRFVAGL
jgi:glycolate oxidase FAD binding subunit